MQKKAEFGILFIVLATGFWGCSTAPRRAEVRSLKPVSAVVIEPQSVPVTTQDSAETQRQNQQGTDQEAALAQAEADNRALEDKLNSALASKKTTTNKNEDSYLK